MQKKLDNKRYRSTEDVLAERLKRREKALGGHDSTSARFLVVKEVGKSNEPATIWTRDIAPNCILG